MRLRILSAQDVERALSMPRAIEAMKRAFSQLSAGQATVPLRPHITTQKGTTLFMPAYLHRTADFGVKIVSIYEANPHRGLPVITATVLVLDPETGLPKALLDGTRLTAIRTGAAGGLAAELLSRSESHTVTLFGAGVQARTQLQAVQAVRDVRRVYLLSRTQRSAERFAREIHGWLDPPEVVLNVSPEEAVREADIVITATSARKPLFDGTNLRPGTHVTAIGSYTPDAREVDTATVTRARIVVDSRETALTEAGDILIPGASIDAEIGEILNDEKPGRQSEEEITFFKSVGVAVQDAVAAAEVLAAAESENLGHIVEI